MEFDPRNTIIQLCVRGIAMEENGKPEEAEKIFLQAWNEATNDFEKFISAHFIARQQKRIPLKLEWLERALHFALKINDESVTGAFSGLYLSISKCHEELNDPYNAKKNYELSVTSPLTINDKGPFYHGTRADLKTGDLLLPGGSSNYKPELKMNHIYFTALANGAGLAAALAQGNAPERVYIVEPTGSFENDPNVTDKKFPGNPTRSYRSLTPLKIVGELKEWDRQSPEQIRKWKEKLAESEGEIIN